MLFHIMLIAVNSSDQSRSVIFVLKPCSLSYILNSDELLVEFAGSIVNAILWRQNCYIHIFIMIYNIFLKCIREIISHHVARIWARSHEAVYQDDRVIISPLWSWSMSELTVHKLYLLALIIFTCQFVKEIYHKNKHYNVPILFQLTSASLFLTIELAIRLSSDK